MHAVELTGQLLLLEIINFLVLVWILKHFLYAPIQKAIVERQQSMSEKP